MQCRVYCHHILMKVMKGSDRLTVLTFIILTTGFQINLKKKSLKYTKNGKTFIN
jgi:hypothetical protein